MNKHYASFSIVCSFSCVYVYDLESSIEDSVWTTKDREDGFLSQEHGCILVTLLDQGLVRINIFLETTPEPRNYESIIAVKLKIASNRLSFRATDDPFFPTFFSFPNGIYDVIFAQTNPLLDDVFPTIDIFFRDSTKSEKETLIG